jgi:cytochrome c oxidase assembly protein subunit 15
LIVVQILLGAGTWIVKFSVPVWAADWLPMEPIAIQADGWLQTNVITAHVAVGSLLLVTALSIALFALRLLANSPAVRSVSTTSRMGAAT